MNSVGADLQMFKSGSNNRGVAEVKDIMAAGKRSQVARLVCEPLLVIFSVVTYCTCLLTQARKSLNVVWFSLKFRVARSMKLVAGVLGCNNSHFSLLLAAGNVLRGVTSATQWQKFHSYVRHKVSVSILIKNLVQSLGSKFKLVQFYIFSWLILENCCVYLPMSSSKTQMLLLEKNIFHKYWLFCHRFCHS